MTNLVQRDRTGNGTLLGRPFADLWGFDPFRSFVPASAGIEITRTESGFSVEIPVAGFKPEQIEVTLEDGVLNVNGKNEKRSFTRALSVPEEIDAERIEAHVEDGMLTLTLGLSPKAQPKKIAVSSR